MFYYDHDATRTWRQAPGSLALTTRFSEGYLNATSEGAPPGLSEVLGEALAAAPGLAGGRYLETRVGFRPVGPDDLPLLGPVSGVGGLVVATGLGPSGLTMGPYAGALAARIALGEAPGIDLAPLNPLRSGRRVG